MSICFVERIEINGKNYEIKIVYCDNKNAYSSLKDDTILVKMPKRWPTKDRQNTIESLIARTIKEIQKGRWTSEGSKKLEFFHGQRIGIMGEHYEIAIVPSKRFGGKIEDNCIVIKTADHQNAQKKTSELICRQISKIALPKVRGRIEHFNSIHFDAEIKRVTIRDNTTTWGSYSRKGSINLNIRLLFMPKEILDYVIVHELAHSRYLSHGKRFWGLVGKVLPNYLERRTWLRNHGWGAMPKILSGQSKITDFPSFC
jgi:predicted metal-dependent hydrolase